MKIEWKKVTWYSQLLAIILFVLVFFIGFRLGVRWQEEKAITDANGKIVQKQSPASTQISIKTQNLKEENFSGTIPVITGTGEVAVQARAYIKKRVDEFRQQANTDVPAIRKEFGTDAPPAQYEIDIEATYTKSEKTESIVLSEYVYTGGANGNSLYKVFTVSYLSGKILPLSGVVKKDKQAEFVSFVQNELNDWRPEGGSTSPVFADDVKNLKFDSFSNWSMNDKNLLIYFDKYMIGPGVLGPVAFSTPLDKIKDFLNKTF